MFDFTLALLYGGNHTVLLLIQHFLLLIHNILIRIAVRSRRANAQASTQ